MKGLKFTLWDDKMMPKRKLLVAALLNILDCLVCLLTLGWVQLNSHFIYLLNNVGK